MSPKVKQESTNYEGNLKDKDSAQMKNQDKPKAFTIKYKRPRGSRACVVCRSRKVRCDAEIHIPCTNCITFGCDCVLPEAKKRGNSGIDSKAKRKQSIAAGYERDKHSMTGNNNMPPKSENQATSTNSNTNEPIINISQVSVPPSLTSTYKTQSQDSTNGHGKASLTFVGASSLATWTQKVGQNHIEITDLFEDVDSSLDSVELEILKLRGAFLLPSKSLALNLFDTYFEHIHPLMPVIDRTDFMKKFNDPNDSPSLMLIQAVLLCGCRISKNPLLLDSKGSNSLATLTFFRRAKALYETNYESDPATVIQSLILIGSYWEGPQDVTRNSFYWTKVAIGLAQGFGFHRDVSNSTKLTKLEKKVWRRIWWCLFEKDRNVAIAFGRPSSIDLNDCDVPMLTLEDFDESDPDQNTVSPYPVNELQALYFIHLVKLAEITGIIINHQYTVKSESLKHKNKFSIIQHCDMLMGVWFTNLPPKLVFSLTDISTQNFYSCLLNAQYYNRLFLIHRSNLLRVAKSNSRNPNNYKYPSWGISFQAARMTAIVSKILLDKDQIQYCPSMFIYIVFTSLMMLIYHVDSPNKIIASTASDSLSISRAVLKELASYWPIARILIHVFEKYADNKFKRAKIIENGNKIEEYQELSASEKAKINQKNFSDLYNSSKANSEYVQSYSKNDRSPIGSHSTGISPSGISYNDKINFNPTTQDQTKEVQTDYSQADPDNISTDLQYATSLNSNKPPNNVSPSSSTQSFPHISLVTEILPMDHNFFDNFEPTQLFPEEFSCPPSRAQSPSNINSIFGNARNSQSSVKMTNQDNFFNSNFMNSDLFSLNVEPGLDSNRAEELSSFFDM